MNNQSNFCLKTVESQCFVSTMLEIGLRPRTEEESINRIGQPAELFKCDWSIRSLFEISDRFPASWTQGLKLLHF